ncbi:MAG TPA: carboxypeptidase regulatory-like domain-containing protein [Pyrinomonadaceae bacterium]
MKGPAILSSSSATRVSGCIIVLIATVLFAGLIQAQETRQTAGNPRGQSIITGRVVFDDTGQAVPRVSVRLVPIRRTEGTVTPPLLVAITTEQGEFRFNGVAAGEYNVVAQADPRVSGAESYSGPLPAGVAAARSEELSQNSKRITIDGRSNTQVELRIPNPHFGAISGYVLAPNGDAVPRVRVMCSSTNKDGVRTFSLSAPTDDKGLFRIERVPPGEYVIGADPPPKPQTSEVGSMSLPLPSLIPTYYPSTVDAASAVPVNVAPDNETAGINISLIERRVRRVSGMVRRRGSGEPVPNVTVQLIPKTSSNQSSASGVGGPQSIVPRVPQIQRTDDKGNWSFSEIPDGEYTLRINPRQALPPPNSSSQSTAGVSRPEPVTFVAKRQDLTVAGSDMTDITLEVSAGGRVSGTIVVDGNKPLPPRLGMMAVGGDAGQPVSTTVQADGSFILIGIPESEVALVPQLRPANTFYVKSIEANGLDLTRQRLEIEDDAEIKNVRVVISTAVAVLTGHVLSAEAKTPLSRVIVFLLPVDPAKHLADAKFTTTTGADGTFSLGVAPGDYVVVPWKPGEPSPAEAVARPNALKITLQPNEHRSLDILK